MAKKKKIAVLYGGKSGEHEISLLSALSVLKALDKTKYDIIPIGLSKQGHCFVNVLEELLQSTPEGLAVQGASSKPLDSLLVKGRFFMPVDAVLPIVHGPLYEDGALQGLLELADVAFVGCSVMSSAIAMDKEMAKRLVRQLGIKTAKHELIDARQSLAQRLQICAGIADSRPWPIFVKPVRLGSSVGTNKVYSLEQLHLAVDEALHFDSEVLIEQFIEAQEIELAVLENKQNHLLPHVSDAGEIHVTHPDGFYSYSAKYTDTSYTSLNIPAALDATIQDEAKNIARKVFVAFKCFGMARVDLFITAEKEIYFNEINTIPGFTDMSMYPSLMKTCGFNYGQLLDELIDLAILRQERKNHLITNYQ